MSKQPVWVDFPSETGWWWSKRGNSKPEMCLVVNEPMMDGAQFAIALFPQRGVKRYLDRVIKDTLYQKVKDAYDTHGGE